MSEQRYSSPQAREHMERGCCPECGSKPGDHYDRNTPALTVAFARCNLYRDGVSARISQYASDLAEARMSEQEVETEIRAGDLTSEHVGMRVFGAGSPGWEPHLVLRSVGEFDKADGKILLAFNWDDDPSPSNSERGKFAIGHFVSPDKVVRIAPAPDFTAPRIPHGDEVREQVAGPEEETRHA